MLLKCFEPIFKQADIATFDRCITFVRVILNSLWEEVLEKIADELCFLYFLNKGCL